MTLDLLSLEFDMVGGQEVVRKLIVKSRSIWVYDIHNGGVTANFCFTSS